MVFCAESIFNLTIAGCGDGSVLVFDNDTGKCLYGYGVMKQGIARLMKLSDDKTKLVVVGDDNNAMVLCYA